MAPRAVTAVQELTKHGIKATAAERCLLRELAERADACGYVWVGMDKIAEQAGFTRRQALRHAGELIAAGHLERIPLVNAQGRQTTSMYHLLIPGLDPDSEESDRDRRVRLRGLRPAHFKAKAGGRGVAETPLLKGGENATPENEVEGWRSGTARGGVSGPRYR